MRLPCGDGCPDSDVDQGGDGDGRCDDEDSAATDQGIRMQCTCALLPGPSRLETTTLVTPLPLHQGA